MKRKQQKFKTGDLLMHTHNRTRGDKARYLMLVLSTAEHHDLLCGLDFYKDDSREIQKDSRIGDWIYSVVFANYSMISEVD